MITTLPVTRSFPRAIPFELFQNILQELPQRELLKLCTISHTLHAEVVRELYRHVDLVNSSNEQLVSLTSLLIAQPNLARLIRALSLPDKLTYEHQEVDDEWLDRLDEQLPRALKSMDNLAALFIEPLPLKQSPQYSFRGVRAVEYLSGDYFLGCPFRLRTFRHAVPAQWVGRTLLPFLYEQNQISDLATRYNHDFTLLPEIPSSAPALLPELSIVSTCYETPNLFNMVASRPIKRLRLVMPMEQAGGIHADIAKGIKQLSLASATLTHFYYVHWIPFSGAEEAPHVETLEIIVKGLPNLKFLRYSDPLVLDVGLFSRCY